ncbi:MAG: Ger(x)C family spore germination protein [Syntrophomonadaceae bacterium]
MYKYLVLPLILVTLFTNCGCWNRLEVEKAVVVSGLGVQLLEDGNMRYALRVEMPRISPEGQFMPPQGIVITATGKNMTHAARNLSLFLPHIPLWSHASSLVLGENLARSDLSHITDVFIRNRNVRMDTDIFITHKVTPYELYSIVDPLTGTSARNLPDLVRDQEFILGQYVPTTLFQMLYKLATPGVDLVVPMLTAATSGNNKTIQLAGLAVFKGPRMVGSLNEMESRGYRWLNPDKNVGGMVAVDMPAGQGRVNFEVVTFYAKQSPRLKDGRLIMDIKVQAYLNFFEQQGTADLVGLYQRRQLEAAAAQQIEKEIWSCIKKSQRLNSDILGWGLNISKYLPAEWKNIQNKWEELYSQTAACINVNCQVDRIYTSTNSFKFDRIPPFP